MRHVRATGGRRAAAATPGPLPAPGTGDVAPPSPAPPSTEVVLHELGESLATAVASVQAELARYPNALGAYLLDEVEVSVPVAMRVDDLGQMLVRVVAPEQAGPATGQVRLKVRPVLGATQPPPLAATQSLAALGALSREEVARLNARRVFSVEDLQRVARNAAGRAALAKVSRRLDLDRLLGRGALLSLPALPPAVAETLVRAGVETPAAFVKGDPEALAATLAGRLGEPVTAEDVKRWQEEVRPLVTLPLPTRPRGPLRGAPPGVEVDGSRVEVDGPTLAPIVQPGGDAPLRPAGAAGRRSGAGRPRRPRRLAVAKHKEAIP